MYLLTKWIRRISPGYCIAFLLLILCYVLTIIISTNLTTQTNAISGTDTTVNRLDQLLTNLKSAQAAWGQYILTSNYKNLDRYYETQRQVDSVFNQIYQFSSLTPPQRRSLDTLNLMLNSMFPEDKRSAIIYNNRNGTKLLDSMQIASTQYATAMDSITEIIKSMQTGAKQKADIKKRTLMSLAGLIKIISYVTLLVALFLAVYMLVIYNKERRAKRKARAEAKDYHKQLEFRIEELTQMNKEIIRLKSMEKFTALGRIATMIAHEIKNPLTNINLAIIQLKEDMELEDSNTFISIIKRNSEKINDQINKFLNVTAFTTLNTKNVSINKLLDEILLEAKDRISLEEITVEKEYSWDICDVSIDSEKIKTAFLNIILNAIDAMKPGEGILRIKTESRQNKCIVTISDNGSGMDKETATRIFEPYYTTKHKHGSGLGLAQTQNIILNHDGSIEVESELNKGTSFIITLNFAGI